MFGFFKKKPANPSASVFEQMTNSATDDVKTKWLYFNATIHFNDETDLSETIDFFSQPIVEFFQSKYPALLIPEAFWLTLFTAILESGTHPKEDVNAAMEKLRHKYSPSAKKTDPFAGALQNFVNAAQVCATEYFSNADYIEGELPKVTMTDSLRQMSLRICKSLKTTSDDVFSELHSWKGGSFSRHELTQRADQVKDLLSKDLHELHALAMSIRAQAEIDDHKFGLANLLIGESATNIFQEFTRVADIAKELGDAPIRA